MIFDSILFKEVSIFPELFLGVAIVYLILHCSFSSIQKSYPLIQTSVLYLAVLILVLGLFLLANDGLDVLEISIFNNTVINDYVSVSSKFIIGVLACGCLLMFNSYLISQRFNQFEYVLLILFSILGLFLLCSANDLITTYLALELQSLAFYVLAAFKKNSSFSIDAGLKYFVIGSFSSSLFLFGSSLLYGATGTVNFDTFKDLFHFVQPGLSFTGHTELCELYYFGEIMSHFKYDLTMYIGEQPNVFASFPKLLGSLVSGPVSFAGVEEQLFFFFSVNDKVSSVLLQLLLGVKESELGRSLFEFYVLSDSCEPGELNPKFLTILSLCEIAETYLQNPLESEGGFNNGLIIFGLLFLLISLCLKLTIAPFHTWAVDVYENSPSSSTFLFSVVPKLAIMVVLLRIFFFSFYGFLGSWNYILLSMVLLSVIIGSFGGLYQRKFKSLLVYSSISHMGYTLIAFGSGSCNNIQILFAYLLIYSFSGLCVWSVFMFTRVKKVNGGKQNKDLTDFLLLGKSNSTLAALFSIVVFSLAGFPPMIGFLVKIDVFSTAIQSSGYFLVIVSIFCSVLSTFYYIRLVKILYFEKALTGRLYYPVDSGELIILVLCFWSFLLLFLNPNLLFLISHKFGLLFPSVGS